MDGQPGPHAGPDRFIFLFRAAARLSRSIGEFNQLPEAERLAWLVFEESEALRQNPQAGPRG